MSSEEQILQDDKKELEYREGVKHKGWLIGSLILTVLMLSLTVALSYDSVPGVKYENRNDFFAAYGIVGLLAFGVYVVTAWSNMKRLNSK